MSYVQRRRFLWILFVAGLALLAIAANATTLARLQFSQIVQNSSVIARLRCVDSQTHLDGGEIWTDWVFEVMQSDKGQLPSRVSVRTPGGVYEHLHSHVDGVPAFHPGEEVFLFLVGHPGIPYRIVGWTQGTFRIRKNTLNGFETVTQDSYGVPMFDPQTRQFVKTGIRDMRVDSFLEKITQEIHR
jgi:hypothetical protein